MISCKVHCLNPGFPHITMYEVLFPNPEFLYITIAEVTRHPGKLLRLLSSILLMLFIYIV